MARSKDLNSFTRKDVENAEPGTHPTIEFLRSVNEQIDRNRERTDYILEFQRPLDERFVSRHHNQEIHIRPGIRGAPRIRTKDERLACTVSLEQRDDSTPDLFEIENSRSIQDEDVSHAPMITRAVEETLQASDRLAKGDGAETR